MTTTQLNLQTSAGVATHTLDDDGNATHSGTVTAVALAVATITTTGAVVLGGAMSSPMTAAAAVAGSGTIALPVGGDFRAVSSASAVTGVILTAGTVAGQTITLANINVSGGDAITFHATPATSRVALASCALVAGTATTFRWNATAALWFPVR